MKRNVVILALVGATGWAALALIAAPACEVKRAIAAAALVAALASPACADPVQLAFRNPVADRPASDRGAFAAMVAIQAVDAFHSGVLNRNANRREMNPEYRALSHCGPLGFAAEFIVSDLVKLAAGRALHVSRASVEAYQTEQSISGVLTTNGARP